MYIRFIKPILDFVIAFIALLLLSPFFMGVLIVLLFINDGKPFFCQIRPGLKGKLFSLIKFKTMNDKTDDEGNLLPDYKRLTPVGKLIRSTSLDELPQLFNVLKGDMSLVGPRPLLKKYLGRYSAEQALRHEVKPGITGWAQVNGRNSISWEKKFELDLYYVSHISLWLDLKILGLTLWKVIRRKGVSAPQSNTMPEFMGTKEKKI